jgi:hypothetical protein
VVPIFLNVRNMPIAEKCITTCFPLSNMGQYGTR